MYCYRNYSVSVSKIPHSLKETLSILKMAFEDGGSVTSNVHRQKNSLNPNTDEIYFFATEGEQVVVVSGEEGNALQHCTSDVTTLTEENGSEDCSAALAGVEDVCVDSDAGETGTVFNKTFVAEDDEQCMGSSSNMERPAFLKLPVGDVLSIVSLCEEETHFITRNEVKTNCFEAANRKSDTVECVSSTADLWEETEETYLKKSERCLQTKGEERKEVKIVGVDNREESFFDGVPLENGVKERTIVEMQGNSVKIAGSSKRAIWKRSLSASRTHGEKSTSSRECFNSAGSVCSNKSRSTFKRHIENIKEYTSQDQDTRGDQMIGVHDITGKIKEKRLAMELTTVSVEESETKSSVTPNCLPSFSSSPKNLESSENDQTKEEERKEKDKIWNSFIPISENEYLTSRYMSKETKGMVCDCVPPMGQARRGEWGCGEDCLNRLLLIECSSKCAFGKKCSNKRFQRKEYAKCDIFKTEKKGFGLKSLDNLPPGTFITEYVGEVINQREFRRRAKKYAKNKNGHSYFMSLTSDAIIDGTMKGNMSRFINHSCEPNAESQKWTVNGEIRIGFFTKVPVKAGQEITLDYQFQRYGRLPQHCYCGSKNCRGWIGKAPEKKVRNGNKEEEKKKEEKKKKNKKKRIGKKKDLRDYLDDIDMKKEIENLTLLGLKTKVDMLTLCRLMVRVEEHGSRILLLKLIQDGDPSCMRSFVDFHGLRLLWSWMTDIGSSMEENDQNLRVEIIQTLSKIPITSKSMLKDSKVTTMIEKWLALKAPDKSDQSAKWKIFIDLASKLIEKWNDVKFRIPKIERQEKSREACSSSQNSNELGKDRLMSPPTKNKMLKYGNRAVLPDFRRRNRESTTREYEQEEQRCTVSEGRPIIQKDDTLELTPNVSPTLAVSIAHSLFCENTSMPSRPNPYSMNVSFRASDTMHPNSTAGVNNPFVAEEYLPNRSATVFPLSAPNPLLSVPPPPPGTPFSFAPPPPCPLDPLPPAGYPLQSPPWRNPYISYNLENTSPGFLNYHNHVQPGEMQQQQQQHQQMNGRSIYYAIHNLPQEPYHSTSDQLFGRQTAGLQFNSPIYQNLYSYQLAPTPQNAPQWPQNPVPPLPPPPQPSLPPKWRCARDAKGRLYYFHCKLRIPQWELPAWPQVEAAMECESSTENEDDTESSSSSEEEKSRAAGEKICCSSAYAAKSENRIVAPDSSNEDSTLQETTRMGKHRGLVQELIISPQREIDAAESCPARETFRSCKGTEFTTEDQGDVGQPSVIENTERAVSVAADSSSQSISRIKDKFRHQIARVVVQHLNSYRKAECTVGRITNVEDFKFLARKISHIVTQKEMKRCQNIKQLKWDDSIGQKTSDYIKMYMSKFDNVYRRSSD